MKLGCFAVCMLFIGCTAFAQTEAYLEYMSHYTDNYHGNATELNGLYHDATFSLTSKKVAWGFEYTGGGMWAHSWSQENYLWSELNLTYTIPVSLYFDLRISPVTGIVYYPDNVYSGARYHLQADIIYDSLLSVREKLTVSYGADIRNDTPYDRNLLSATLDGVWDITPNISLLHVINIESEEWTELFSLQGKKPYGYIYSATIGSELHLGTAVLGTLSYTYSKKDSNVSSILRIDEAEYLETNSDSYTYSNMYAASAVYFSTFMIEPYVDYSLQQYDSRKAFLSATVVSENTVTTTAVTIGVQSRVTLSPKWFFIADINYSSSDSNDYFETGSGINAQCGVIVNF